MHTTLNRFYATLPRELDSERVTAENLEAAIELVHRCLDDALESGVRLDLTELQAAELRHSLRSDLEGFLRDEAASEVEFLPRRLEVAFGSERAAPELQRGLPLADELWLSGKIDRIDIDPFSARGIVQDYKSGKGAHSAREIDRELRLQIPLYILALRDLVGVEPLGGVYRALAGRRLTRGMLRESAREDLPGFAKDDYLDEDAFWSQVEAARERAADERAAHPRRRRAPRPEGRRLPGRGATSGRSAGCRGRDRRGSRTGLNEEQLAAVEADGSVFVSAGAGTGKTSVLVERYVRAVCEHGIDVESILVITYTRKAAGELRTRIRAALRERGRPDLARELDGAWISTIHGFCNRLLRAHPFAAGLDPRFRELEDAGAAVLRGEAFERALQEFCAGGDPERLRLLATYRADGSSPDAHGRLRDASLRRTRPRARARASGRASRDAVATLRRRGAGAGRRRGGDRDPAPERRRGSSACSTRGRRRSGSSISRHSPARERARPRSSWRGRRSSARRSRSWPRTTASFCRSCSSASAPSTRPRSGASRSSTSRTSSSPRATCSATTRQSARRPQLRFRIVMVDEFQDTNRLQCELIDLVAHPELTEVFTVGDEFQSIYGFRHADLEVFRERRAQAPNLLALTRQLPLAPAGARGGEPPLRRRVRRRLPAARGVGGVRGPGLRASGRAARHRQVELRRVRASTGARARRGGSPRRVRELVDSGEAEPGEIVVLFAAGTDAERYEEALRREGLPTYRATGRGYFGQQQVVDLLAYLRLLHNRYDDVALATVLASPFVGVSNDALVLIRRNAPRRPLFTALERTLPGAARRERRAPAARVPPALRAPRARGSRGSGSRSSASGSSREHDYDLAVLARWDGARRFANLRKLGRLARDYEAVRGADIEGFVRFVRDQDALGARELEAVAEEEGGGAVRLLTIHAAKGLEFKVVIVADAGRDIGGPRGTGRDRRALGRALRLPHGAPDARRPAAGVRLRGGPGRRSATRSGRSGFASTTSR